MRYRFVKRLNAGLVVLNGSEYGDQMWASAKLRKRVDCQDCQRTLQPGTVAYRPMTNGYNRMERICELCIDSRAT